VLELVNLSLKITELFLGWFVKLFEKSSRRFFVDKSVWFRSSQLSDSDVHFTELMIRLGCLYTLLARHKDTTLMILNTTSVAGVAFTIYPITTSSANLRTSFFNHRCLIHVIRLMLIYIRPSVTGVAMEWWRESLVINVNNLDINVYVININFVNYFLNML